jgi:hypothetical protein
MRDTHEIMLDAIGDVAKVAQDATRGIVESPLDASIAACLQAAVALCVRGADMTHEDASEFCKEAIDMIAKQWASEEPS